jgi:integrase
LGLEIQPSGIKSWRFRFKREGKPAKINLGRWPAVGLATARLRRDVLAGFKQGEITVKHFAEKYLRDVVSKTRRDIRGVERYFARDIFPRLGTRPISSIEADEVREIVFTRRDAGKPQAAIAIRNLLKRLWDYAIVCGVAAVNPATATPIKFIAKTTSRSRTLDENELRIFLRAIDLNRRLDIALLLILLTLTRKSELRLARWSEFNLYSIPAEWNIPPEHSKMGNGQIVYLSRQAVELLQLLKPMIAGNTYVLPARGSRETPTGCSTLNRALGRIPHGLQHFTVHDLRRTASTMLAEQGNAPDVIEKALNHRLRGVRGIYNRAEYGPQRLKMLQEWADYLDKLRGC